MTFIAWMLITVMSIIGSIAGNRIAAWIGRRIYPPGH